MIAKDKYVVIECIDGRFNRIWVFDSVNEALSFRELMAIKYKGTEHVFHSQRTSSEKDYYKK